MNTMFCDQCQETAGGHGCTVKGVCGKTADTAVLQDAVIYGLKGLCRLNTLLEKKGKADPEVGPIVILGLFRTITNANFKDRDFCVQLEQLVQKRNSLCPEQNFACTDPLLAGFLNWNPTSLADYLEKGKSEGLLNEKNEDIRSLKELVLYGLKGMAAYVMHAERLGYEKASVGEFIQHTMAALDENHTVEEWLSVVMETGQYGVEVMALLDEANTTSFGHPEMTIVDLGVRRNPGILVSGHDLKDIEELLIQTEGTGIDVYTHGEMLPAHYYPALKKYKHLVGNYGNAWWKQKEEFESFGGPVLFTTNCIVPPSKKAGYHDRIFTTGAAGLPGAIHIPDARPGAMKDFSALIAKARQCDAPSELEKGTLTGGFAHHQILELANPITEAVKSGAIRRFVVMAGCDGRMAGRDYYARFAQQLPKDTVILTAGCAKYRYNKLNLGDINGIPRVIDAGQCNDSYSLVVVALRLMEIFEVDDVNELPITYNIAWYEQKAVIVLLALLSLGVKNIHLGPSLPAFLSPGVLNVLIDQFSVSGISSVEEDVAILG